MHNDFHRDNLARTIRGLETHNDYMVLCGRDAVPYVLEQADSTQDRMLGKQCQDPQCDIPGIGERAAERAGELIGLGPEESHLFFRDDGPFSPQEEKRRPIQGTKDLLGAFWQLQKQLRGSEPLALRDVYEALEKGPAKGERLQALNKALQSLEAQKDYDEWAGISIESGQDGVRNILLHCGDGHDGMALIEDEELQDDRPGPYQPNRYCVERAGEILGMTPEASHLFFAKENSEIRSPNDMEQALRSLKEATVNAEDGTQPLGKGDVEEVLQSISPDDLQSTLGA